MRIDGYSSLDFMYWILESVEENYQAVGNEMPFQINEDGTIMHGTIVDTALICGIEVPRTFDALMAKVARYETAIAPEEAFHTRGSILECNGRLTVSVGDSDRLVGADAEGAISMYQMTISEATLEHWTGAFLIPEMRYL